MLVVDQADDPLTGVTRVDAGTWFSLARKSDGTGWSWGNNYAAQIGVGADPVNKLVPVQILFADISNRMFELLGPYFITPGEAVNYAVLYKNVLKSVLEDAIVLVELSGTLEYWRAKAMASTGRHVARYSGNWKAERK